MSAEGHEHWAELSSLVDRLLDAAPEDRVALIDGRVAWIGLA